MGIIDEKGRLFGRINIIDFVAVIFLLSLMPMVYFGYKLANKPTSTLPKTVEEWRYIKLKAEGVILEVSNLTQEGDIGYEIIESEGKKTKREICVIKNVLKKDFQTSLLQIEGRYLTLTTNPSRTDLVVIVALLCKINEKGEAVFKGQALKAGSCLTLEIPNYILSGTILNSYAQEDDFKKEITNLQYSWYALKIKVKYLMPEIVDAIKEGDAEKAYNGDVVLELKKVLSITPSKFSAFYKNAFIDFGMQILKDADLSFKAKVIVDKKSLIFLKEIPIRFGDEIEFTTPLYRIRGAIIGLEKWHD